MRAVHFIWSLIGLHVPRAIARPTSSRRGARSAPQRACTSCAFALLNFAYPLFVFALLNAQSALMVVDFVHTRDWSIAPLFFFSLIVPTQYALAYVYVRKRHFDNVLRCVRRADDDRYERFPRTAVTLIVVGLTSVVATLACAVLTALGHPTQGFDFLLDRFPRLHALLYAGFVLHWLYSWCVCVARGDRRRESI